MAISNVPSAESRIKFLYPEGGPGRQLKARLKAGDVQIGGILDEYARPLLVKLYQQAGFDFVYIEYEHVMFSPTALADTVIAARDVGVPVIAKTPQLKRQEVSKLLEIGVVGIQLPRTESREQVETLHSYVKFRPRAPGPSLRDTATATTSSPPIGPPGWPARTPKPRSWSTSRRSWATTTPRR